MKGETIKLKLSLLGKTQKELAELLGVTPQAISEILSSTDVRTGTIEKICKALNLSIASFFDERTDESFQSKGDVNIEGKEKMRSVDNFGDKVKYLLKTKNKKLIGLCQHTGKTDAGLRKMFERNNCNISVLVKIADFFGVPVTYFLPKEIKAEEDKDKEIEYLRGMVNAYENALGISRLSETIAQNHVINQESMIGI